MIIVREEVKNVVNLDYFEIEKYPNIAEHVLDVRNHYRLLTYISNLYNNILILDLGTSHGWSCLSLAQNLSNTIYTYDTTPKDIRYISERYNVIFKNMDANSEANEILSNAKIIFLDIDPHEGTQEIKFYNNLLKTEFSGILLCDDIKLNQGMINFWNSIQKEKYDLTEIGHWSGTGLVNFSNEKIEII